MSRLKKSAAAGAMACGLIGGFEGLRQTAYPDPGTHGKPWTICYGHATGDVRPGDHMSVDQCKMLLLKDTEVYATAVENCTAHDVIAAMPDARYVAFVSFAYNLGSGRYCKSIAPLVNAGRTRAACDKLLQFNRAAGVVLPGLTSRRQRERAFCMEGL